VGRLEGGLEGFQWARRECLLEAFDAGKYTSGRTTRVCRSGRLPPVDTVRVCSSGILSGEGIPRQDYPKTRSGSPSPQLGGVGCACCHTTAKYRPAATAKLCCRRQGRATPSATAKPRAHRQGRSPSDIAPSLAPSPPRGLTPSANAMPRPTHRQTSPRRHRRAPLKAPARRKNRCAYSEDAGATAPRADSGTDHRRGCRRRRRPGPLPPSADDVHVGGAFE